MADSLFFLFYSFYLDCLFLIIPTWVLQFLFSHQPPECYVYKNIYNALSSRSYNSIKPEGESLVSYQHPPRTQDLTSCEVGFKLCLREYDSCNKSAERDKDKSIKQIKEYNAIWLTRTLTTGDATFSLGNIIFGAGQVGECSRQRS